MEIIELVNTTNEYTFEEAAIITIKCGREDIKKYKLGKCEVKQK